MATIGIISGSFCKSKSLCVFAKDRLQGHELIFANSEEAKSTEDWLKLLSDCDGLIIGREKISPAFLDKLPNLRVLAKYGVGIDNLDLSALSDRGIKLLYKPGINADAVAEHTIGLILALIRNIAKNDRLLHEGVWKKNGGTTLRGKTVAIVGVGAIGSRVARLLKTFGCELILVDPEDRTVLAEELGARTETYSAALKLADIVSFHVPLDTTTFKMLNTENLSLLKKSAFVINTSRGEVLDQNALKSHLKNGLICGVGLDVFEEEPLADFELSSMSQMVLTPHTAGNSQEAVQAMGEAAVELIRGFFL